MALSFFQLSSASRKHFLRSLQQIEESDERLRFIDCLTADSIWICRERFARTVLRGFGWGRLFILCIFGMVILFALWFRLRSLDTLKDRISPFFPFSVIERQIATDRAGLHYPAKKS
jgi:hypothetical protein